MPGLAKKNLPGGSLKYTSSYIKKSACLGVVAEYYSHQYCLKHYWHYFDIAG
jgi:hypothetical protein